jgi:SWIM zinc finger
VQGGVCDCPDAKKRGQPCKHALAVQIHQQAAALLMPSPCVAPTLAAESSAHSQPTPKTRPLNLSPFVEG